MFALVFYFLWKTFDTLIFVFLETTAKRKLCDFPLLHRRERSTKTYASKR